MLTFDLMVKHLIVTFIVIACGVKVSAQRLPAAASRISIRNIKNIVVPFTPLKEPKFTLTNGILSVSVLSEQNELFEITEIPIQYVKDTILSGKSFKAILVTSTSPFVSNTTDPNASIEIRCSNPAVGERIVLFINTPIYRKKTKYMVRATLRGKMPNQTSNTNH